MTTPLPSKDDERMRFLQRRFMARCKPFRGPMPAVALLNLVLLVLLLVLFQSSFVLQPGVVVNLPSSPFVSGVPYSAFVVTVTQDGLVFFDDEQLTLDGLQAAFARMAFERPDSPLIIEADGRVQHSVIIRIYNMAMAVGVREILVATRAAATAAVPP